jgi:hypothetical protein
LPRSRPPRHDEQAVAASVEALKHGDSRAAHVLTYERIMDEWSGSIGHPGFDAQGASRLARAALDAAELAVGHRQEPEGMPVVSFVVTGVPKEGWKLAAPVQPEIARAIESGRAESETPVLAASADETASSRP